MQSIDHRNHVYVVPERHSAHRSHQQSLSELEVLHDALMFAKPGDHKRYEYYMAEPIMAEAKHAIEARQRDDTGRRNLPDHRYGGKWNEVFFGMLQKPVISVYQPPPPVYF